MRHNLQQLMLSSHFIQFIIDKLTSDSAIYTSSVASHYGGWEIYHSYGILCVPRFALHTLAEDYAVRV